jgi:cell division initiation protein
MNVSPLDLRQQRFSSALRGFDRVEVTSFLMAVAEDYEAALRETDRLRQEVMRMEAALNEHREQERSLKGTLMAAQKLAEDIKTNADEEARRIVADAQGRADLIVERSQNRLEGVQREIEALKQKRKDVETSLSGTIQTLKNALEFVREQDAHDRDDKVLLHRPRQAEPAKAEPPARAPMAQGSSS